jgi:hypothetical protein
MTPFSNYLFICFDRGKNKKTPEKGVNSGEKEK